MSKKRIVIVGMGFGGINASSALSLAGHDLLMIDRNNYHLFQPLLYQVATAGLEEEAIAYPLRALIRHWNSGHFRMAEVFGVDLDNKRIVLDDGSVEYDYLIIATGSKTNFFSISSIEKYAFDLKRLDHAESLRNHILLMFEKASHEADSQHRKALLTFVVVGGGPTGVEFSGALRELIVHVLSKDLPEVSISESRIILVEAADSVLSAMPGKLSVYAVDRLREMGIEVMLETRVTSATANTVSFGNGDVLAAHTLFWAAGVSASELAESLTSVAKTATGRVEVSGDLSLENHPEVFVIGDVSACRQDGTVLPMMAPVAIQQGRYAAMAVLSRIAGKDIKPFRYVDKGAMATIGRSSAVASSHGINFKGFSAWLVWLVLHLYYLIGFRNRILVLLNWAYYYVFHERQIRLITKYD